MNNLVFINACIRQEQSRTYQIASRLLTLLSQKYNIHTIDLTVSDLYCVTANQYRERHTKEIPEQDLTLANRVSHADRIVIAAPFWDMSFPSILKTFIEHISIEGITFKNLEDGSTVGKCKADKLLYITTRGMDIPTDSELDQGSSYLKAIGWLWGIPEIITVAATGMNIYDEITVKERIESAIETGLRICNNF